MSWVNNLSKIDRRFIRTYSPYDRTSKAIRQKFLDYFINSHSHSFVRSSPVVPFCDPSVAFVNAGMNQFKGVFLGKQDAPFLKVANSQKCVRVGGKHNDLDEVGQDGYHHTFFEMLGNWSFGDYFKKEACTLAWNLLTKEFHLNPNRLYVTYFEGDPNLGLEADLETKEIWKSLGVPENRIIPFGPKENFWEMGDVGPCGPSTEIHIDHITSTNRANFVNKGLHDLTELWNIVFIQYNRRDDNQIEQLPKKHIDTGMGFERLVAVIQGKISNYDTDIFNYLINAIHKNCNNVKKYSGKFGERDWNNLDTSYRILADHARMITVCLADGIIPEQNQKLRRVMRKAFALGETTFNRERGLLKDLSNYVIEQLGHCYPELERNVKQIHQIINYEENLYESIRDAAAVEWKKIVKDNNKLSGLDVIETPGIVAAFKEIKKVQLSKIDGKLGFKLYDTHGLDKYIIEKLANCLGIPFESKQFDKELDLARTRTKQQLIKNTDDLTEKLFESNLPKTDVSDIYNYVYNEEQRRYIFNELPVKLLKIIFNDNLVNQTCGNVKCKLILDKTNMYSEAGGQMSDQGVIHFDNCDFIVNNVQNINGYIVHDGELKTDRNDCILNCEMTGVLKIDADRRIKHMKNHTATHLLNAVLKDIKGATCQKSSKVTDNFLNLDVGIFQDKINTKEIEMVERRVQELIKGQFPVSIKKVDNQQLYSMDYVTLIPGEVYPDTGIRIIEIVGDNGFISREPCCGTHVTNTADIQDFCITDVKSLGRSTTAIYAVTGSMANKIRQQSEEFENAIREFENKLESNREEIEKLGNKLIQFRNNLNSDASSTLPYLLRCEYLDRINKINAEIKNASKDKAKALVETEIQKALESNVLQTKKRRQKYVVHSIVNTNIDGSFPLQKATKLCNDLPVIIIACADNVVKARCCVPQHLTAMISAQKWLEEAVASTFNAPVAPPKGQNADYVCNMKSKKVNGDVERLMKKCEEAARKYIEEHL